MTSCNPCRNHSSISLNIGLCPGSITGLDLGTCMEAFRSVKNTVARHIGSKHGMLGKKETEV